MRFGRLAPFIVVAGIVGACDAGSSGSQGDSGVPALDAGDADAPPRDAGGPIVCVPVQPGIPPSEARIPPPYAGAVNPLGATAARDGRALFPIWCARCHGLDARGGGTGSDPPPADLTAAARPDDYLFWRISEGGHGDPICSQMPSFSHALSEDERWQLVAYLRSIEPETGAPDAGSD